MNTELVRQSAAGVVRAIATTLSTVPQIERELRLLADAIELSNPAHANAKPKRKRGPVPLKSTVEFNDFDSKIADRALARHYVR